MGVLGVKGGGRVWEDEMKEVVREGDRKVVKGLKRKEGKSLDGVVGFEGEYKRSFVLGEGKKEKKF